MLRTLTLLLALLVAVAAGSPGVRAQTMTKITVAGATSELPHWLPLYVALAKFFPEAGLDAQWVPLRSGSAEVAAVMGGSAQIAPVGVDLPILSYANGGDLVLISDLFDLQPYSVVLSNDAIAKSGITPSMSTIDKLQRLKGMKIAITGPGSATDNFIRNILKQRGIDPDTFLSLQPLGDPDAMLAAMQRNLIDGFIMSSPADEIAVQRGIGRPVLDEFSGQLPELANVPFAGIVTTKRQLAADPELFQRIVTAIAKSIKYVHDNPTDTRRLIRPYFADIDDKTFDAIFVKYSRESAKSAVLTRPQYDAELRWVNFGSAKPLSVPYDAVVDMSFATKGMNAK
jgi:NitT/TauT family transport system substrate-binding protein